MISKSLVLLAIGWGSWCVVHSLLISRSVSGAIQKWLGKYTYYYRVLFNLVALLTLIPLMIATLILGGERIFVWRGVWIILQLMILGTSLWLFRDGSRHYDLGYMLGIRQIQNRQHHGLLVEGDQFSRLGSHGLSRHPWYLGVLLFLWSFLPVYRESSVVAATVLTVYIVIGTILEERKLLAEFGESYRQYQREVSMLIPWKWIMRKLKKEI